MKRLILMALVVSAIAIYHPAKAQVSLQINIGSQPNWGSRAYNDVGYYYPIHQPRHSVNRRVHKTYYSRPIVRHNEVRRVEYRYAKKHEKYNHNRPSKSRGNHHGRK